ncbi:polymerase acidic protein [Quaranjavirus johnstonense]|uniref:Polymerase acidic protein n=1 Tax=Quaranjavirus johnstonense TaxID=688437 RepID=A0A6B9XKC7_9ORTO|nr:polymerase acidic protein [Quaranjavirus johnstonense]QHR77125.1 polymerase acidic protein [Quaranjavirus johnstonense]
MAFEAHRILIADPQLYEPEFVSQAGELSEHWARENWKRREESLRHDKVCMLLMNTEPRLDGHIQPDSRAHGGSSGSVQTEEEEKTFSLEDIEGLAEHGRGVYRENQELVEEGLGSHSPDTESQGEESGEEEDFIFGAEEEDPDDTPSEIVKLLEPDLIDSNYRYTLLEGVTSGKYAQMEFTNLWGISTSNQWDLVDRIKRKLIEVKVTTRVPLDVWKEVQEHASGTDPEHYGAYIIHDDLCGNFVPYKFGNIDDLPGWPHALDFLIRRHALLMSHGGVPTAGGIEDRAPLWDEVFMTKTRDWVAPLWKRDDFRVRRDDASRMQPFNIKDFLNLLEDPRNRDSRRTAKWKGKLLPVSWCKTVASTQDRDLDMVQVVLEDMGPIGMWEEVNANPFKVERTVTALAVLLSIFKEGFENRDPYVSVKKKPKGWVIQGKPKSEEITEALMELGVGYKPYQMTGVVEPDMRQDDTEDIEKVRWDDWMTDLMESEAEELGTKTFKAGIFSEAESRHILDDPAKKLCSKIYDLFRSHKVGATCSKVMGFYSRMGGSYLRAITGKNRQHSSLAIFPLYYKTYDSEGNGTRNLTGFVIRGPHHVRESTDTINLLIVEKTNLTREQLRRRLAGGALINGTWWVRKNAVRKTDSTYLSFLHNSLFVPTNFLGELVTTHPNISMAKDNPAYWEIILSGSFGCCKTFHLRRVIETVLMGILGKSQEEGYHDMYRKVYMLLMAKGRGDIAQVMDIKAMAEEMNECLLDSAFVLWCHSELIDFMKFVSNREPFSS